MADDLRYLQYYDLENYLFETVHNRFQSEGSLCAFDFFSIVIWKADPAKSRIAGRLLAKDPQQSNDLNGIARGLTASLFSAESHADRLRLLIEDWDLCLPMASAILAVLWPDYFAVYDDRVCEQLGRFQELSEPSRFENIWSGYQQYREAVVAAGPQDLSLREKERYLEGMSAARQLERDLETCFAKPGGGNLPGPEEIEESAARPDTESVHSEVAAGERRLELFSENDMLGGTRQVWLSLTPKGTLILAGQDLGGAAGSYWGAQEYEWAWLLNPEQLGPFLLSLGIEPSEPVVLESIRAALNGLDRVDLQKVFEKAGATFWSRIGNAG